MTATGIAFSTIIDPNSVELAFDLDCADQSINGCICRPLQSR